MNFKPIVEEDSRILKTINISLTHVCFSAMINVGLGKFSRLCSDNDVVDGNVDELDEESNESHESKANGCSNGNLLELLPVWLGAPLDQPD